MTKPVHILVLDDEENILRSIKRLLINEPYGVFATSDPDEGELCLREHPIKVVLSDQRMPKIAGVEFLRRVKEANAQIVRILFTGYADMQVAEEAINRGEVYRFVSKPWVDEDLRATIREAAARFDLVEENKKLLELTRRQNRELQSANEPLQRLIEKEKEFSSTVSHELRTPLSSIKMAIDVIKRRVAGHLDEKGLECIDIAKKSADRLSRLVNDILSLTKLEANADTFVMQAGDINSLIREVVTVHQGVAEQKGLYLKADLEDSLPLLPMQPDKLNQVLSNLISNAIKFTEKGGISVSSRRLEDGKCVAVTVEDTGRGIAEKDVPQLFQKFKQVGDPEHRVEGTGLGLAICKKIVELHQGSIRVESQLEKGSRFIFVLPSGEQKG